MSTLVRLVVAAFAFASASSAEAAGMFNFTLNNPSQSISASGGTLDFSGTLSAPSTNMGLVYLNGDTTNSSTGVDVDDSPFFFNGPLFLLLGQTFDGLLFTATVDPSAAGSALGGFFSILGGDNDTAQQVLGTEAFSIAVTAPISAVPEPATWGMMIFGVGMMGYAMRRRQKVRTTVSFA